jgi:hypothetical protein
MKYYVVGKVEEEYNDEYYVLQEGVTPEHVFKDKTKAFDSCYEKTIKRLKEIEGDRYEYQLSGFFEGEWLTTNDEKLLRQLIKNAGFPLYKVYEITE